MSSGLYRGASGLSLGPTLPLGYPGYWHGTAWDRSASNAGVIYRDGVSIPTFTTASEALQSDDFFVCAYNNGGAVSAISNRPVTGMAWGGHLTAAQHAAVVAALNV